MSFTTLFFDLDDTLYPSSNGLWEAIRERMNTYMTERLSILPDDVARLRHHYYLTYGTTLRGLQVHHQVDAQDFLAYVHDLQLADFLQVNPALRTLVASLPQSRWIFTNADAAHARRVLSLLNLSDLFHGIVDIVAVDFACKPNPQAYRRALEVAGESDPRRCVFLDDSPRNLAPARKIGFFTVMIGSQTPDPAADMSLTSLYDLPDALPALWNGQPQER